MKHNLLFIVAASLMILGCATSKNLQQMPIECLASELDGSLTLLVTGSGRNYNDAREQALKNAVSAVLFDGIRKDAIGYMAKPLIFEVNARERHQDYFNIFFVDGGAYENYVSMEDTRILSRQKTKDRNEVHVRITTRVLIPQLKQRLIEDKIINYK